MLPVEDLVDLISPHGDHINDVHERSDLVDHHQRTYPSELLRKLFRQHDQVIFADRSKLHSQSVLVVDSIVLEVLGDELLTLLGPAHHLVLNEVCQPVGMGLVLELEVQPVMSLLDPDRLLSRIVLQDQLLQEQECSLVIHSLSNLDLGHPGVRGVVLLTFITLNIVQLKLDDESLLQESVIGDLFLDSQLYFDPVGVGLCPHERSVYHLHPLQTLDVL
mmetsp:Transcript_17295/g.16499  ORF Transcript_17295/g.16499 Transcript_17295/m.16499 type:complete len:219 (-) Transcript_17295:382-1038(-)|eukprot:CAMPEP_0170548540 /NCGR_PEP_ID=MMETSP0211-20121228/6836_1 /TAXON_ID=311385 /ORGANISM="Pseudokeronopsis sp., Strain OXSARD2" /LENGTH=218 /DNA_ID=CAMNT_0010854135 /DNA_START=926 /DNA_END=1582 /DNA_ORIENTATION=+